MGFLNAISLVFKLIGDVATRYVKDMQFLF